MRNPQKVVQKERRDKTRQGFLLTFFEEDRYTEKEVNGYWLIKQYNSDTGNWQVAIFSNEAFQKRKEWKLERRGN